MSFNTFDKRMKKYEQVTSGTRFIERVPIIARVDGKCFSSYTRNNNFIKPFDTKLMNTFKVTTLALDIEYSVAYGQSDEVSFLFYSNSYKTEQPYGGKLFKMISILASLFTANFNKFMNSNSLAYFDCRVFQLPKEEVTNYFIWRQKDAVRNSLQSLAQANFSQKELNNKKTSDILDMLIDKGINWNDLKVSFKRGWCVYRGELDNEIPIFTKDRDYIEKLLN